MNMMVKVAENQCEAPCPNLASDSPPSKPLWTISLSPHYQRKNVVECSRAWKNSYPGPGCVSSLPGPWCCTKGKWLTSFTSRWMAMQSYLSTRNQSSASVKSLTAASGKQKPSKPSLSSSALVLAYCCQEIWLTMPL